MDKQNGQAMVEFSIVAAFVLIPLFLLVPILGKLIDIKHKTIQAARYEAWEFTAWNYDSSSDRFDGYDETIPVKARGDLKNEANNRFYTTTGSTITRADSGNWNSANVNTLWRDHKPEPTILITTPNTNSTVGESDTPDAIGALSTPVSEIINAVGTAAGLLSDLLGIIGVDAGFTQIESKGKFTGTSVSQINALDWFSQPGDTIADPFADNLTFTHQAAVMSEAWSGGGRDHTQYQVRGLVPTSLLDIEGLNDIRDFVATYLPAPELHSDWLKFGYVQDDAVPADRLFTGTTQGVVKCNESLVYYGDYDTTGFDIDFPSPAGGITYTTPDPDLGNTGVKKTTPLSGDTAKFGTCASL